MKKFLRVIVSAMILCIMLTGCTKKEEKKTVILNLKTPSIQMTSYNDTDVNDSYTFLKKAGEAFAAQYDKANVIINVEQFDHAKEDSVIKDNFGTEDAVDILLEEYFNMFDYIHTGRVVPLDDIITDEIRNDIDEAYWRNSIVNGKTYLMPYLTMQNVLCYNKDLFRMAGLEKYISDKDEVQSWSLDDWNYILKTLKEKLPENKYAMLMYAKNDQGDTHIMTLLRSHGSTFFDENGRIKLNTKEGIDAINWLMECNKNGYFPPNAENLEINDCQALFKNNQLGIVMTNILVEEQYIDVPFEYGYVNFVTEDGKGLNTLFNRGFEVFDNGDADKVMVAKDFIKFIYENEEWLELSAGSIPCSKKVINKYISEDSPETKFIENAKNGWNFTNNTPSWRGVRNVFYKNIQDLLYGQMTAEEIANQIEETCNAVIDEGYKTSILHE